MFQYLELILQKTLKKPIKQQFFLQKWAFILLRLVL